MVKNKKTIAYNMKIVFNIKFIAYTSNIKKISENIKSDVITSKVWHLYSLGSTNLTKVKQARLLPAPLLK